MSTRRNVHGSEPYPHINCPDPALCDCECTPCKRAWSAAGRPDPGTPKEWPKNIYATTAGQLWRDMGEREYIEVDPVPVEPEPVPGREWTMLAAVVHVGRVLWFWKLT